MKDKYIILFLLIHYFFLRLYGKDLSEAIKVQKEKYWNIRLPYETVKKLQIFLTKLSTAKIHAFSCIDFSFVIPPNTSQ